MRCCQFGPPPEREGAGVEVQTGGFVRAESSLVPGGQMGVLIAAAECPLLGRGMRVGSSPQVQARGGQRRREEWGVVAVGI